jgi:tRNA-guanine family transglycosylase
MQLSLRWAQRSKDAHQALGNKNALFGIVQGGMYEDLRCDSASALINIDFDGFAIGGLSVGEPKEEMIKVLGSTLKPPIANPSKSILMSAEADSQRKSSYIPPCTMPNNAFLLPNA